MQNEIIINAEPGETRVAILERSNFSELHIERHRDRSVVGNVVKGRVTRVLPGMQCAFVDIGLDKAAFLYAGDYFDNIPHPEGGNGSAAQPVRRRRGRNGNGRAAPRIETVLSEGDEIVVRIAKEPIGTKGARISSDISIPGRHLVLTPWEKRVGVSRRIDSDRERRRLREIVERLRPRDVGFIIRTAGDGVREADLEADIRYLTSVWDNIQLRNQDSSAPCVLYSELDLPLKMIRDFANAETKQIAVDSKQVYAELSDFVSRFVAEPRPRIEHYEGPEPIFEHFSLESQIHANLQRKVWLRSGGSLIIDQSEALTAIDVNTGRYVGKRDLEETVLKTNLEAVKESVNQLRFRNIGGLIIIDLIDMESAENKDKVYRALHEALRQDKARTNILKISELGLVEMTRKRTRENLIQTVCEPCPSCEGRGYLLSRESVAYKVMRAIRTDLPRFCGRHIAITVSPQVAEELLLSDGLKTLGEQLGREIEVRARPGLHQEQFEVTALDAGPPVSIPLRWLEDPPQPERKEATSEPELAVPDTSDDPSAPAGSEAQLESPAAAPPPVTPEVSPRAGEEGASSSVAGDEVPAGAGGQIASSLDDGNESRILPPAESEKPEES